MKILIMLQYLEHNETINIKDYIYTFKMFTFQWPIAFHLLPSAGILWKNIIKSCHTQL